MGSGAGGASAFADPAFRDLDAAGGQSVLLISHVAPPAGIVDRVVRIEAGRTV
ncbi:hypothetical protein GCM10010221_71880 [Streptomyces parvus]|nr:hypothetical protein GCM10010221_71880 [Streptomyces parvus]